MMRIAVTGGSGFLGRQVLRRASAQGWSVRSISRGRLSAPADVQDQEAWTCDIRDRDRLRDAFRGQDAVVHCAALSSAWGPRRDFLMQNVEGTRCVIEAAAAAGVARLVHISSSSVYFAFRDQLAIREDQALPSPVNAYAESKQLAERHALAFPGATFILRPRGLFGPGDPHLLPRFLRVLRRGRMPLLRGGRALADLTDVGVAADAVIAALKAPESAGGVYNVSQGQPIAIRDLAERIARGLSCEVSWQPLPLRLALAAAGTLEALARLGGSGREPPVTRYSLGLFAFSQTLDLTAARTRLCWQPELDLRDSLDRALRPLAAKDAI